METDKEQELSEAEKDLLDLADISADKYIKEIKVNQKSKKQNEEETAKIN